MCCAPAPDTPAVDMERPACLDGSRRRRLRERSRHPDWRGVREPGERGPDQRVTGGCGRTPPWGERFVKLLAYPVASADR